MLSFVSHRCIHMRTPVAIFGSLGVCKPPLADIILSHPPDLT